ncbi:MAG: HD domain-containing protein, partial [Clostridia bacterium]|nr:HD domain-containing protein [Clostridia bacterium]
MVTKRIRAYVEEECRKATSGLDMLFEEHILVVANYAELLAERFNADKEVVELAAYLHDFSVIVDPETANEHHIAGA